MSKDASTTVEEIVGQIKMKDGTSRSFRIGTDFGWTQWGECTRNLGNSGPIIEAMVDGLKDAEVSVESDHDEDDEYEDEYEDEPETEMAQAPDPDATYKIVRHFKDDNLEKRVIKRGLTLAEAKAHCDNPETSSDGTGARARKITETYGEWFDGWTRES